MVKTLRANPTILTLLALAQIIAGLALTLTHSIFVADYRIIITIIGYWIIIEGIFYLGVSKKFMKKFLIWFSHPGWYTSGGIITIIIGAYLVVKGFGWWM